MDEYKKNICVYPFYHAEIDFNGEVYCCCPDYTNFYSFGNIFEQSFEEIWFGEKWSNFRYNLLNDNYCKCNLEMCNGLDDHQMQSKDIVIDAFEEKLFPMHITLSIDSICNVQCVMCRDWNYPLNAVERQRLEDKFEDLVYMMKDAEEVTLDGAGEVFASTFHKKLIREATSRYPQLKFDILTNGLRCNEQVIKEYGLEDRINSITISLHAGRKGTYSRIVRNSDWCTVIKNIEYVSKLKKAGKINEFSLTFVLSSLNFLDLPRFIKLANKYGAYPNIWPIRPYNDCECCREAEKYDITNENHPQHFLLSYVFEDPIIKENHLLVNSQLGLYSNKELE